jgi:hypothetical protein
VNGEQKEEMENQKKEKNWGEGSGGGMKTKKRRITKRKAQF